MNLKKKMKIIFKKMHCGPKLPLKTKAKMKIIIIIIIIRNKLIF